MNLYRSFGCMLESWVSEGYPEASCCSEEALERQQDATSSDSASADSIRLAGTNLRSESEDSGVDLSNVGSPKASRSKVVTSEDSLALKQAVISETEEDVQPSSPASPASSLCSSSSSCFSAAQSLATTSVEQTLRRNEPEWKQASPFLEKSLDAGPRRRCNTTSLTTGLHTATSRMPHRTGSVGSGRPHTQPVDHHTQTLQQLGLSGGVPAEVFDGQTNWDGLSPGLLYLERVCRMLEEIARLQQQNQTLQLEMDSVRGQKRETHNETASIQKHDISSVNKRPEVLHLEDESRPLIHGFRRRTVSDTWAFLKHRSRKGKTTQIEPFASTDVLHEEPDGSLQLSVESEQKKASNSLKQKMSSLRKNEKLNHSRSNSLHGEKSVLKLFRNRRKTTQL